MIFWKRVGCAALTLLIAVGLLSGYALTSRDAPDTVVPDYKQADERWADIMYSNHGDPEQTIKNGGCALCALANVIYSLCDDSVTPIEVAELALKEGYCGDGGATLMSFLSAISGYYPLAVHKTNDISEALKCLDEGGLVICIVGHSAWNMFYDKVHAITLYAYTDDTCWVFDPATSDPVMSGILGHPLREKLALVTRHFYCYWAVEKC